MKRNFNPVDVELSIENPSIERGAFYRLCFITESDIATRTLKVARLQDLLDNGYSRLDLAYNFCVGVFSQQGIDTVYIRAKRSSESYVEAYNSDDNSMYYFVVLQTKCLTEIKKFNRHLVSSDEMKLQFFSQNLGSKILQSPKLVNYYQDYTFSGEASVGSKDYYLNKAYGIATVDNKIPLPDYLLAGYGNTAIDYVIQSLKIEAIYPLTEYLLEGYGDAAIDYVIQNLKIEPIVNKIPLPDYLLEGYGNTTIDFVIQKLKIKPEVIYPLTEYLLGGYGNSAIDYGVRMMVGEEYIWEIDKEGRRVRYAPSSTPSPVENWEYLPILDVAVQVKRNAIAGHAESIEAVNNSLPFEIPNYEPDITITGVGSIGETLTATVTDKNGVPSDINYQWYADGEAILDSTSDTYVVKESDSGKTITVQADFTDKDGFSESVTGTVDVEVVDAGDMGLRADYSGTGWYKATDTGTVFNKDVPALETHVFSDSPTEYVSAHTAEDAKLYGERAAVSNITTMDGLFASDAEFNEDISSWDVSSVTDMSSMFNGATAFNSDISSWDVSSVTDMSSMFNGAAAFNSDISSWDISNVTDMSSMFVQATSFNQDLSGWDVSLIPEKPASFDGATDSWILPKPVWGTNGNGEAMSPVKLKAEADSSGELPVVINFEGGSARVDFGDGSEVLEHTNSVEHTYPASPLEGEPVPYSITVTPTSRIPLLSTDIRELTDWGSSGIVKRFKFLHPSPIVPDFIPPWLLDTSHMFEMCQGLHQDLSSWDVSNVTNMSSMFEMCQGFSQDLSSWDVSNVTNMSYMFKECRSQSSDLSNWDVSKVTDMKHMFEQAGYFSGSLENWDTSNVTDMSYMFSNGAAHRPLSIGSWDVSEVTDMSYMFNKASSFNSDLSAWDVSNVVDMSYMFSECNSLLDETTPVGYWSLEKWDVSKVTDMSYMFNKAISFNSDLSAWDVSNVVDMSYMFAECRVLFDETTPVGYWSLEKWDVSKVTNMERMFYSCYNGVPSNISRWKTGNVTNMKEMFSNCRNMNHLTFWDTSKVTTMEGMFEDAYRFNSDISNWDVSNVVNMDRMFKGVTSLLASLDKWCVEKISEEPIEFAPDSDNMPDENKPVWGTCPRGEDSL